MCRRRVAWTALGNAASAGDGADDVSAGSKDAGDGNGALPSEQGNYIVPTQPLVKSTCVFTSKFRMRKSRVLPSVLSIKPEAKALD